MKGRPGTRCERDELGVGVVVVDDVAVGDLVGAADALREDENDAVGLLEVLRVGAIVTVPLPLELQVTVSLDVMDADNEGDCELNEVKEGASFEAERVEVSNKLDAAL